MIAEAFLVCALALPPAHHYWPVILPWCTESDEEENLKKWLRKHEEIDDIFIHEKPQEELLKKDGWERVPFTHRGRQIWIKRKPKSDGPQKRIITAA